MADPKSENAEFSLNLMDYLAPQSKGVCSRCGGVTIKGSGSPEVCGKCLLNDLMVDDVLDTDEIG